jgi:hypothetical protein
MSPLNSHGLFGMSKLVRAIRRKYFAAARKPPARNSRQTHCIFIITSIRHAAQRLQSISPRPAHSCDRLCKRSGSSQRWGISTSRHKKQREEVHDQAIVRQRNRGDPVGDSGGGIGCKGSVHATSTDHHLDYAGISGTRGLAIYADREWREFRYGEQRGGVEWGCVDDGLCEF